jgi:hypothetical protein
MINEADRHRIGRARLLRREGKTYDEIRAAIGPIRNEDLAAWLRGIARPKETWRGKALDDLRRRCRQLRTGGLTYDEIADITGASAGSLSLWLRDLPQDAARAKIHRLEAVRATRGRARQERAVARADVIASAANEIGPVADRELWLVGLGLYWAEGTKSKSWAIRDRITFINSDPSMISVFLRWLALLGVSRDRCRFRVSIHESADVPAAETYWANLVGVSAATFKRATIKRHSPKTVRYNTGDDYRGCLVVDVLKSADLYRCVEGWWRGLTVGVVAVDPGASLLGTSLSARNV